MAFRIWGRPTSACTQKALWGIEEAGIDYELILASATMGAGGHVSKGNKPYGIVDTPMYRAMNPNGTVPTIDDGGYILWESNSIVRYVSMTYAPEKMYGNDIGLFCDASRWMDWEASGQLPGQHIVVMHTVRLPPAQRDPQELARGVAMLEGKFRLLDAHLKGRKYVCGDRFTLGDIPVGMRAARWLLFDIERPKTPHLCDWVERLKERPAFQKHLGDPQLHLGG
ncbi:MAG: glutathione S-transferase family protein [Alphaproteobacteria bacterium]